MDVGLVCEADHVLACLLKLQRTVHLNDKLADSKMSVSALHEHALLFGVRPFQTEKLYEPVPECAPRYFPM